MGELIPLHMDVPQIAAAFAASGMFKDARGEAAAVTKIIAGRSIGLDPFSAMAGLHVMQGKVEVGSHVIAAAIKRSDRYDYRVREKSATACRIEFFERGESVGVETYSTLDAKRAGLTDGKNAHTWKKYPKAMLFARCISSGYRTYCPDVFSVPVYVEGEASRPEQTRVIDVTRLASPRPASPRPASPRPASPNPAQPRIASPDPRPAVEIARPAAQEPEPVGPGYSLTVEDLRRIDDLAGTRGKLRAEAGKTLRESVMTQGIVAGLTSAAKKELARDQHMLAIALALTELRSERKALEEDTHESALVVFRDIDPGPAEIQIACREAGIPRSRAVENYSVSELGVIAARVLATRKEAMSTIEHLGVEDLEQVMTTCEVERRPVEEMGEDLLIIVDEARRQGLVA